MAPELDDSLESSKLYYSISEVSEMLGVNPSVLRFWETEFEQIHPRKSRTGKRFYDKKDIALLKQIHYLLKIQKFTIEGAKEFLQSHKPTVASVQTKETLVKIRQFLLELKSVLENLDNDINK
ncbi:MAG: MerR family transcriptional regulator [Bacteroidia bacterium]|nr:MerR family transcriptional regulator [Bacteroidia bacterium]